MTTAYDKLVAIKTSLTKVMADLDKVLPEVKALCYRPRLGAISYFRSSVLWAQTLVAKPGVVIINPSSGPGSTPDATYVQQVQANKVAKVATFGYVHTQYGARAIADVKTDILAHKNWYSVEGIFVDTTSNKLELFSYYQQVAAYIRELGMKVTFNPGTRAYRELAVLADYIMVAETTADKYLARTADTWESEPALSEKLWDAVHTCPASSLNQVIAKAKSRKVGLFWVTDDVMTNPYDSLPTYLSYLTTELNK